MPINAMMLRTPEPKPAGRSPVGSNGWGNFAAPDFAEAHPFAPSNWAETPAAAPHGMMTAAAPTGSFQQQNEDANKGFYQEGTFGAENARANGTGHVLPAGQHVGMMSPDVIKQMMSRPVPGNSGVNPGQMALMGADDARAAVAREAAFSPLTLMGGRGGVEKPGSASFDPASFMQSKLGFADKLALRAAGIPEAPGRPDVPRGPDGWVRGLGTAPGIAMPTAYDANQSAVHDAAANAREIMQRNTRPGLIDLGVGADGKPMQGIRQPGGKITPIKPPTEKTKPATGIEEIKVGPKTYFYHHESKKYFDEKGAPVNMNSSLGAILEGETAKEAQPAEEAAPAAAAQPEATAATGPKVIYNHADVQAEMKRRGLIK